MRKRIKIIIPLVLFLGIGYMLFKTYQKIESKNKIALQIKTIPDFEFLDINSNKNFTKQQLNKKKPVLFVYFNSECDHCSYEMQQISYFIKDFNHTQIVLISIEEPEIIKAFVKKYNFLNQSNVIVLHDKTLNFEKIFGNCPFPTTFIYDRNWELVKQFKGEVKVEALLKYLNM
ncbi:MAG: peroxiredoxin family protein [Thiohalospira sp.]